MLLPFLNLKDHKVKSAKEKDIVQSTAIPAHLLRVPSLKKTGSINLNKNNMKNQNTPKNPPQDKGNSQNQHTGPKNSDPNTNPYDSENLDNESESATKDITEKDIERDLIENDPSQGFETDMDNGKSNESQSDAFETIQPDQDNPVNRELEIGSLSSEELQQDELARDETDGSAVPFNKPSGRKF
jgi:hypothetical protein